LEIAAEKISGTPLLRLAEAGYVFAIFLYLMFWFSQREQTQLVALLLLSKRARIRGG
jgi:hypothetical protein